MTKRPMEQVLNYRRARLRTIADETGISVEDVEFVETTFANGWTEGVAIKGGAIGTVPPDLKGEWADVKDALGQFRRRLEELEDFLEKQPALFWLVLSDQASMPEEDAGTWASVTREFRDAAFRASTLSGTGGRPTRPEWLNDMASHLYEKGYKKTQFIALAAHYWPGKGAGEAWRLATRRG